MEQLSVSRRPQPGRPGSLAVFFLHTTYWSLFYSGEFWDTSTQGQDIKVDHAPEGTATREQFTLLDA